MNNTCEAVAGIRRGIVDTFANKTVNSGHKVKSAGRVKSW